ncbi:MAG: histidine phosphatase family protein [Chloroflexi bacterium]|nr:histidine phosphatase family protein [Chloroflexota bacterium]
MRLDIVIHMDAVDRRQWQGAPDDRPLTVLGKRQSALIAEQLTAAGPIGGLFSSPALRCRESLEPLTAKTGLPVVVLPGFRDTLGYKAPDGWANPERPADPLGGALSAGSAYGALQEVRERVRDGRAVLCSYGDIVPALLAFLAGFGGAAMPARNMDKGAVYSVNLDGSVVRLTLQPPQAGFPQ